MDDFQVLRKKLNDCINWLRAQGEPGKMYEGEWEVISYYSGADEDPDAEQEPATTIKLNCYLVGPTRHYEWGGKNFREAFNKCRNDVVTWIVEAYDELGIEPKENL